jgi:hypothetical protein
VSSPATAPTVYAPLPLLRAMTQQHWPTISLLHRRNETGCSQRPIAKPHLSQSRSNPTESHRPRAARPCTIGFKTSHTSKPHHHHLKEPIGTKLNLIGTAKNLPYRTSSLVPTARPIDPSRPSLRPPPWNSALLPIRATRSMPALDRSEKRAALAPKRPRAIRV